MTKEISSFSLVHLLAGQLAQPGAPLLHLAMIYNAESGAVSGEAMITCAVMPSLDRILVRHIHGEVHGLGLGAATRVLTVQGEFLQSLPPPATGSFAEKFSATFVTDHYWKGHGSFEFGKHKVNNVPVAPRS